MFGRATIRLGIGPHSSYILTLHSQWRNSTLFLHGYVNRIFACILNAFSKPPEW